MLNKIHTDRKDIAYHKVLVQLLALPLLAALEAEALAIGRQQQFDGGGVEADAVVQPAHAVLGIDNLSSGNEA